MPDRLGVAIEAASSLLGPGAGRRLPGGGGRLRRPGGGPLPVDGPPRGGARGAPGAPPGRGPARRYRPRRGPRRGARRLRRRGARRGADDRRPLRRRRPRRAWAAVDRPPPVARGRRPRRRHRRPRPRPSVPPCRGRRDGRRRPTRRSDVALRRSPGRPAAPVSRSGWPRPTSARSSATGSRRPPATPGLSSAPRAGRAVPRLPPRGVGLGLAGSWPGRGAGGYPARLSRPSRSPSLSLGAAPGLGPGLPASIAGRDLRLRPVRRGLDAFDRRRGRPRCRLRHPRFDAASALFQLRRSPRRSPVRGGPGTGGRRLGIS